MNNTAEVINMELKVIKEGQTVASGIVGESTEVKDHWKYDDFNQYNRNKEIFNTVHKNEKVFTTVEDFKVEEWTNVQVVPLSHNTIMYNVNPDVHKKGSRAIVKNAPSYSTLQEFKIKKTEWANDTVLNKKFPFNDYDIKEIIEKTDLSTAQVARLIMYVHDVTVDLGGIDFELSI